jgi:hypothetical protein
MTIATKNGAIIVKDGSIAENCACCESGWYCCPAAACFGDHINNVTVTLSAEDYYLRSFSTFNGNTIYANGFRGSLANGTYSLPRVTSNWWQLIAPNAAIRELFLSVSLPSPCCSSFSWSLNVYWNVHISFSASITTPQLLWGTAPVLREKLQAVVGSSATCVAPISSSESAEFDAFPHDTPPANSEGFGSSLVTAAVSIT